MSEQHKMKTTEELKLELEAAKEDAHSTRMVSAKEQVMSVFDESIAKYERDFGMSTEQLMEVMTEDYLAEHLWKIDWYILVQKREQAREMFNKSNEAP